MRPSPFTDLARFGMVAALLAAAGSSAGCHQAAKPAASPTSKAPLTDPSSAWLRDVAREAGVDFIYDNGEAANRYTLLESLGGGVGLIDYDRDGWLDIVLPGGGGFDREGSAIHGKVTRLFRNLANGKFEDVTAATGLDQMSFYSHGVAAADYDRDGWPDFVVTGFTRLALFHNESDGQGGRRFVDVATAAGIADKFWSTSAAWGDLDGNGYADLYVCHYADWSFANDPICPKADTPHGRDVCPPQRFKPLPDSLYLNQGKGTFRDATHEQTIRADGCGLGVVVADIDANGQPDLYVGNDATPNFLYLNRNGRLEERGGQSGVALDESGDYDGSMGVDVGDYDATGRAAIWVTNFQNELHALYAQQDSGYFYHASKAAGIAALGRKYVGFGTGFLDFDNDGWEDLAIVNGHVLRYPAGADYRQRAVLLHNVDRQGRRFFENVTPRGGEYFGRPLLGRGLAIGDLNNDGWPDLVVSHTGEPVAVLINQRREAQHHWLGVELVGRDGRDVAGATLTLERDGKKMTRYAKGGGSYLSSGDRRILFGLGKSPTMGRLTVRWPWGQEQSWEGLESGGYYRLHESRPDAERINARPPGAAH